MMKVAISLIAWAVTCLVQISVAVDYVRVKLSEPRPQRASLPGFGATYRHIKNCLMDKPFEYGELWIRKSPGHAR